MYTSAPGHIVHHSKFIGSVDTDIAVSCAHEVMGICAIYEHMRGIFVADTYKVITCEITHV